MPITVLSSRDGPEPSEPSPAPDPAAPSPPASGDPGASAPPVEPPAAPTPDEPASPASAPDVPDRPDGPEDDDEEVPGLSRGVQRRIDRLTRQREEARRESAAIKARLEMLEQGYQRPPQAPQPVPLHQQPEPREEDYPSQQEWFKAVRDWDKAQLKQELAREQQQQRQQDAQRQQEARLVEQATIARQKYADFDTVLDRLRDVYSAPALDACVQESELGAELAYYLAQHPDEMQRLNQVAQTAPLAMAREIGKLEMRLSSPTNGTSASRPSGSSGSTVPPPPPQPVSGGSNGAPTDYRDDMSQAEFEAWRRRALAPMRPAR